MKKNKLFLLFSLFFPLTSCNGISLFNRKNIPVYEGMKIQNDQTRTNSKSFKNSTHDSGNGWGDENHPNHGSKPKQEIDDIVGIDVITEDKVGYYTKPSETFILEIHFSNPKDYEIQSFVINERKYASYMFQKGSTMECVLIEMNAPSTFGYYDYNISAIKYIDNTTIKNVDMSKGNKTIKLAVSHSSMPTASVVSMNPHVTSIDFIIDVTDPENLIEENSLKFFLGDGEDKLVSKNITLGRNTVAFDGLRASTPYSYGVSAVFDFIDENERSTHWLLNSDFKTKNGISISNIEIGVNTFSFDCSKEDSSVRVTSCTLRELESNTVVSEINQLKPEDNTFTSLEGSKDYVLVIDYSYVTEGTNELQQDYFAYCFKTYIAEPEYIHVESIDEYYNYCEEHGKSHETYYVPYIFVCEFKIVSLTYNTGNLFNTSLTHQEIGCGIIFADKNNHFINTSAIWMTSDIFKWNCVKGYYEQCEYPKSATGFLNYFNENGLGIGSKLRLCVMDTLSGFGNFDGMSGDFVWASVATDFE